MKARSRVGSAVLLCLIIGAAVVVCVYWNRIPEWLEGPLAAPHWPAVIYVAISIARWVLVPRDTRQPATYTPFRLLSWAVRPYLETIGGGVVVYSSFATIHRLFYMEALRTSVPDTERWTIAGLLVLILVMLYSPNAATLFLFMARKKSKVAAVRITPADGVQVNIKHDIRSAE